MANRNYILYLIISLIILVFVGLYFYFQSYNPKFRWDENYRYENDQPYGLKLLYDILSADQKKNNFKLVTVSPKTILKNSDTSSLYMFIGANFLVDSLDSYALIDFVKRGNNVFISSISSKHDLFDILTRNYYPTLYYDEYWDSITFISFDRLSPDSTFKFDYRVGKEIKPYSWNGMESTIIDDSLEFYWVERISHLPNGAVDCFRIKCGKGWFIFHFNPICFSNYSLTKASGLNYFNRLLSEYKKQKIYWDEYSKSPLMSDSQNPTHESPLRFILSERSLRWTWYLICFFVLLYVIFNAKRKQAYIPLIPENKNTTKEYIQSIAALHYNKSSLVYMADEIMRQFQSFIKHKYNISPKLEKREIIQQLMLKSGVNREILDLLFKHYGRVKYDPTPASIDLIEFYRFVEFFYKNCK